MLIGICDHTFFAVRKSSVSKLKTNQARQLKQLQEGEQPAEAVGCGSEFGSVIASATFLKACDNELNCYERYFHLNTRSQYPPRSRTPCQGYKRLLAGKT
jgi:hypothetical protein